MSLNLQEHQQEAYDNALKLFENGRYAAVIFPTGCGKSFVTLKLIQDNIDKKILFLSPLNAINNQMDNYIIKWLGENVDIKNRNNPVKSIVPHFRSMLYQTLLRDNESTRKVIEKLNPDIIILDEMHHLKTDNNEENEQDENVWGQKVKELLDMYPNAKVLGLTATPERTDGINTVERLFDGKIASEITLVEALQSDKIHLKAPTYIPSDYALGEKLEGILEEIEKCEDEEKKKKLKNLYEKMRRIVNKADGIPELLKKNITKKDGKYIVFCGSKEDMEAKMKQAKEWFGEIDEEPEIYAIASAYRTEKGVRYNEQQIEQFEKSDSKHLKLLFSIDMLNEGIHIDDVSGVIMTRKTDSRLVYLQQVGRALSSDQNRETPIVFDLVNNYITYNLYNEIKEKRDKQEADTQIGKDGEHQGSNYKLEAFEQFRIKGQAQELLTLLDDIENTLDNKIEYNGEQLALKAIAKKERISYVTLFKYYKQTGNINEAVEQSKAVAREKIEYNGEQLALGTIAKKEGIVPATLKRYYNQTGNIYEAVEQSKAGANGPRGSIEKIEYNGEQLALKAIARQEKISYVTLIKYYNQTGNIKEAVEQSKAVAIGPRGSIEKIEYNGEQLALGTIAKKEGIDPNRLKGYYNQTGGDIYEAVKQSKAVAIEKIEYNGKQMSLRAIARQEEIERSILSKYYNQTGNIYKAVEQSKAGQREKIEYNRKQMSLRAIAIQERINLTTLRKYYNQTRDIYEAVEQSKAGQREKIEYNGEQLALETIARNEGINPTTLRKYYNQTGNMKEAVEQSKAVAIGPRGSIEKIEYKGKQMSLMAIARQEEINYTTLGRYYNQTGNINEAVHKLKMRKGDMDERNESISLEEGTENLQEKEQEQQQLIAKRDAAKKLYEGAKTVLENKQKGNEDNSGEGK